MEFKIQDNDFEDEIPLAQLMSIKINKSKKNYKWCVNDSMDGPGTLSSFFGSEATNIQGNSPLEYFLSLFAEDIVENIVYQTNIHAAQNNKLNFGLTKEEFYRFLGINLIMSYIKYPRLCLYWSSDEGLRMNLIANSMSVNRYELISRYMHFIDRLKENFLATAEPEEYQSVDEQIIPLKGRLNFGACVEVFLRLEELQLRGIWATGTLRLSRLQNPKSSLKSGKDMKREGRGSVSVATTESENVTVTKCMDNNAVRLTSSCAGNKPQNCTQR
ncbi:hypothetical protein ILUMI_01521 [Ignelater luminosus]|uniref:PiggyBac transposable element-derived protein domain-containing protein n=1 Tax=Ignelater luminosus TaxID=2038154 RepID=A0A8K0DIC5_IGNLU|nr:hypothetical protein ILUMI_01521 [Ignelater luminosus]